MSITFKVSDVRSVGLGISPVPVRNVFKKVRNGRDVEACGVVPIAGEDVDRMILPTKNNALVGAVEMAYSRHLPLVLSPDDIWVAIAQGFALHVNNNAEALRSRFVRHEGRQQIDIIRNDFRKGSPDNDWTGCFGQFSDAIAEHIGKQRDLVVSGFSTTGIVERAASEVVLMDAMQSYFKYVVHTLCGIPEITLLGTVDDWRSIRTRAGVLAEYDLGWWTDKLLPVIDQFVSAFSGNVDRRFWESIYKEMGGSGGTRVSGWISTLFPYLDNWQTKKHDRRNTFDGFVSEAAFPRGLSTVPFLWKYYDTDFPMQLVAGFVGADHVDGAIRPTLGWAVGDAEQALGETP